MINQKQSIILKSTKFRDMHPLSSCQQAMDTMKVHLGFSEGLEDSGDYSLITTFEMLRIFKPDMFLNNKF